MNSWPSQRFWTVPSTRVAGELAAKVRAAVGQDDKQLVGCNLHAVCSLGGFLPRATRFDTANSHQALLVPKLAGGFEIFVDPGRGASDEATIRRRARFRIAHEIAHSFFYDRTAVPAMRQTTPTDEEEDFCDAFASALLVPPKAVASVSPCARSVRTMRDALDVSLEVAGRALAQAHPDTMVACLRWQTNQVTGEDADWRVVWATGKAGGRFVPVNVRLRSELIAAAARDGAAEGKAEVAFGRNRAEFQVAALKLATQLVVTLRPTSRDALPHRTYRAGQSG